MKLEPNWSVQNLYLTKGKALIATPLQLTIAPDALLEGWGHTVQAKDRRLLDLSGKKKKIISSALTIRKKVREQALPSIFASSKAFWRQKFSCLFLPAARVHD